MATSYTNVTLTTEWVDLTVANAALANVPVVVQNRSIAQAVFIFFGGASAPATNDGALLDHGDSVDGTSDHIWARSQGTAQLYTALKD